MTPSRTAEADPAPSKTRSRADKNRALPGVWGVHAADALLVALFLALTFLLGVFPMGDTDFWWHLRTGDLIRQTGQVPHVDPFLYGGPPEKPWIDLHWGFEVLLSFGYEWGGMVAVNLAKCAITTLALLILLTTRKRDWPLWVMVLAWLPALLLLSGRMYVRPETLTLLYMSIFLAVLFRFDRWPWLAMILPVVQVLWVNSQGLFVLGPIVLGFALADAACRRGAFRPDRARWWGIVLSATLLTGLACLINPYGIQGALFPLALVGTMGNKVFESIGELRPILRFIQESGSLQNLSLQLHFALLAIGALSFVVPGVWQLGVWAESRREGRGRPEPESKGRKKRQVKAKKGEEPPVWRLSVFRLLLASAFSFLSFKATRNSHQFATVMGAVTAWNFAEWASAIRARRLSRGSVPQASTRLIPRVLTLGVVASVFALVASGGFYALAGEGRTIGLGERPLWFPHEAVKFAGQPGMPERFLCFHNGHASLYEYYHGPEKKVYADARLEVVGPDLFTEYGELDRQIASDGPSWRRKLKEQGNPGVLLDLVQTGSERSVATLMADPDWACVWFDPIACVFVNRSYPASRDEVDFRARHFSPDRRTDPRGLEALVASARALRNLSYSLLERNRIDLARPLILLGHGYAHRAVALDPRSAEAWKQVGQLELMRSPLGPSAKSNRLRQPFEPIFDLSAARSTATLREAVSMGDDFTTLYSLVGLLGDQGMISSTVPLMERLVLMKTFNRHQVGFQEQFATQLEQVRSSLSRQPVETSWSNLNDLEHRVDALLDSGRVEEAAGLLESAYSPRTRTWAIADRIATLRLRLGEPSQARSAWQSVPDLPSPSLQKARLALTFLVEEQYEEARRLLKESLSSEPNLFEAAYLLAVLETDAGRAASARESAQKALETAPDDLTRGVVGDLLRILPGGDPR